MRQQKEKARRNRPADEANEDAERPTQRREVEQGVIVATYGNRSEKEAQTYAQSPFARWPKDLRRLLLEFVSVPDVLTLFRTYKFFAVFSQLDTLWRWYLQRDMPEEFACCGGELPCFVVDKTHPWYDSRLGQEKDTIANMMFGGDSGWKRYYLHLRHIYFLASRNVNELRHVRDASFADAYRETQVWLKAQTVLVRRHLRISPSMSRTTIFVAQVMRLQNGDKTMVASHLSIAQFSDEDVAREFFGPSPSEREHWALKYVRLWRISWYPNEYADHYLNIRIDDNVDSFYDLSHAIQRNDYFSQSDLKAFEAFTRGQDWRTQESRDIIVQAWRIQTDTFHNPSVLLGLALNSVRNYDYTVNVVLTHFGTYEIFVHPETSRRIKSLMHNNKSLRHYLHLRDWWTTSFAYTEHGGTAVATLQSLKTMFLSAPRSPNDSNKITILRHCVNCRVEKAPSELFGTRREPSNVFCGRSCQRAWAEKNK
jgi:hypothetical protein